MKVPVQNTKGKLTGDFITELCRDDIKVNITAICDVKQFINEGYPLMYPVIYSFFAGRIADTGKNPVEQIKAFKLPFENMDAEVLWASPREVLNIYQAEQAGADIITCTPELIDKYEKFKGMDLNELSLMTVKQFRQDAIDSGFEL